MELSSAVKYVGKVRVERTLFKGPYNVVLYTAYEPCNVDSHATLMCLNGVWLGQVGSKKSNREKNEERSYGFILSAFPESKFGNKKGGYISGTPK